MQSHGNLLGIFAVTKMRFHFLFILSGQSGQDFSLVCLVLPIGLDCEPYVGGCGPDYTEVAEGLYSLG